MFREEKKPLLMFLTLSRDGIVPLPRFVGASCGLW